MLTSLSTDQLKAIHSAILDSGIANQLAPKNRHYKAIFKKLKDESSGKQKKIYAALSKANRVEMGRMIDVMINSNNKTPCTKRCQLNNGVCFGCNRTLQEIIDAGKNK